MPGRRGMERFKLLTARMIKPLLIPLYKIKVSGNLVRSGKERVLSFLPARFRNDLLRARGRILVQNGHRTGELVEKVVENCCSAERLRAEMAG